jgi:transducin (beta)-like 1
VTSDEVNYLVFRYLQESGFYHTAFVFAAESAVNKTKIKPTSVPTGSLVSFLQKGLQYTELEVHVNADGEEETRCKVPFSLCKPHECRISTQTAPSQSSLEQDSPQHPASPSGTAASSKKAARRRKGKEKEPPKTQLPTITLDNAPSYAQTSQSQLDDDNAAEPRTLSDDAVPVGSESAGLTIPDSRVTVLKGHQSEVFLCSWNPKIENILASGSADSTVRIWEVAPSTSTQLSPIVLKHAVNVADGSSKDVTSIDWNRDGTLIATGSTDGIARVWNLDGQLIHTLKKHDGAICSLKWNQRGDLLLSGSVDKTTIVWDAVKGQVKQQYDFHAEPTIDVDWRDNSTFATCSTDRNIYVCEVGKFTPVRCMKGHIHEVNAIKWDPSGRLLASCSDDATAKLWSITKERYLYDLAEHTKEIYTITWSPSSTQPLLATASFDTTVKLWDAETGLCVHTLVGHTDPVYSVAFNQQGDLIASGAFDRKLYLWSVRQGAVVASYRVDGGIFEVGWSASGNSVAIADSNKTLSVVDLRFLSSQKV